MNYVKMWAEEDHNYFDLEPSLLNYGPKAEKKFGYGIKEAFMFGKGFHAEFYLSDNELKRNREEGYRFLMNKKKFKFLISEIKKSSEELKEKIQSLLQLDLKKLSNKELWDVYDFFGFKLGEIFVCYSMTQPHKVSKLEQELLEFLKKKNLDDITKTLSVLTSPKTRFIFTSSGNDLFKSFSETVQKENAKIKKSLYDKPLSKELKQDSRKKEALLKKLDASERIRRISEILSILAEERMRMRFVWMKALYYSELFLIEIKRRFNIPKKYLRMYVAPEIEKLVIEGKKLSAGKLKIRELGLVKIINYGQIETLEGKKAVMFMNEINSQQQKLSELVGMIASKGKVVGKVVLLSYKKAAEHSKKIKNMSRGDIVVTEMTRPNIIPACEKAGAIITDEGGVLSHAAIVSRELKIPCIIGTQMATSVLKDGDYVEVDAERGIVKKICLAEYETKRRNFSRKKYKIRKEKRIKLNRLKNKPILWFSEIGKKDIPSVGGKGANLGELSKFIEVPRGFCISVLAYENFIKKNNLKNKLKKILSKINIEDDKSLKEKSNKIKKLILRLNIEESLQREIIKNYRKLPSKNVAVRSSATAEDLPSASFAGQQDTYLNISSEKGLISSIKKCWASLFNERAIYYREKNKFNHLDVSISVVIQEMINPEFSGVMFTKDPLDKKYTLIEVVKGIGEKLVSGEVTPNSYLIDRKNNILKEDERFKIDKKDIFLDLANIGRDIENHFKEPQDIEWAIDNKEKIFILQSRPITA